MIKTILAQAVEDYAISNPVIPGEGEYTKMSGNPLAPLIIRLWRSIVVLGGLTLLLFFVWGALDWMMSEGDQEKLKSAKNKITHALLGMGLLAASFVIMALLKNIFGFDILTIVWPTP